MYQPTLKVTAIALLAGMGLTACGSEPAVKEAPIAKTAEKVMDKGAPKTMSASEKLDLAVAGSHRGDAAKRDEWRNPAETLAFFGLEPSMSVVEIWPGGGWYTNIIAPYMASGGGTYYAAGFDTSGGSEYRINAMKRFTDKFTTNEDLYGEVVVTALPSVDGIAPAGSADMVLSFRNVHNWMGGDFSAEAFQAFYDALKPGGILGIVEHRLPEGVEQDPKARNGYVSEATVKEMAAAAGFTFVGASEVNANPKDTADHPFGVWTLQPRLRTPEEGSEEAASFDAEKYKAIGESDRMTLKFVKPMVIEEAMTE